MVVRVGFKGRELGNSFVVMEVLYLDCGGNYISL